MINFLSTLHVIVVLCLISLILLQKSDGGIGMMSGSSNSVFSARGASNFLTRMTGILAAIFLANCVLMSVITSNQLRNGSDIGVQKSEQKIPAHKVPVRKK